MKFYKVGYCEYNVTANIGSTEILVATTRFPLIGLDKIYLMMYFPHAEASEKIIDFRYITENELLETVKKIIIKKLYRMQNDILQALHTIEFDNQTCIRKYGISDHYTFGRVYGAN